MTAYRQDFQMKTEKAKPIKATRLPRW